MRRLFCLLATAALIGTACGGSSPNQSSSDGEGTLLAALLKMQGQPSSVKITLHSDPRSLAATHSANGHHLSASEIHTILSSSVTVSRNGASDPSALRSETSVNVGGHANAFESRTVDQKTYLRVDASTLATVFGKGPSDLRELRKEAKAGGLTFVGPALEGKWLSLPTKLGGAAPSAPSSQQKAAGSAFLQRLLGAATVKNVGQDSAGTHLAVEAPLREVYAGIRDFVAKLSNGMAPPTLLPDPSGIPAGNIRVDAWVKDGKLTQLELDLLQLARFSDQPVPAGAHTLGLRMTFSDFTGTITAPAGAVPIHLNGLSQGLMGGMTQTAGAGSTL